jgi:hypothetical protein
MIKIRTKLFNLRLNRIGYVPTSRLFGALAIGDFGFTKKGESEFVYIEYDTGDFELVRYDARIKKWLILTFPKSGIIDARYATSAELVARAAA